MTPAFIWSHVSAFFNTNSQVLYMDFVHLLNLFWGNICCPTNIIRKGPLFEEI